MFIKFEIKFLIIKPKTKRKCRLLGLSFHNVARHRVFVYFGCARSLLLNEI